MLLLSQRALTASDADHLLFADRGEELKRVCRALDLGLNIYVWGPRGAGRTSLLHQVQRLRPDSSYVRLEGFKNMAERLSEVERVLSGKRLLQRQERVSRDPFASLLNYELRTVTVAEDPVQRLRAAAGVASDGPRRVILADDLSRGDLQEMFGRLRDNMWELPIQWVVAGESASLSPPADTFFDVNVELPLLDRDSLAVLLQRRAASGTPQEERLLQALAISALEAIAPCTPRRALTILRELYLADDAAEVTSGLSRIEDIRARLRPTANKVLEALLVHGPAHAGDERLLAEVGVTRSRIVQVLAELEAEGLISAERVGRRKLYAAVSGGEIQEKSGEGSASDRLI